MHVRHTEVLHQAHDRLALLHHDCEPLDCLLRCREDPARPVHWPCVARIAAAELACILHQTTRSSLACSSTSLKTPYAVRAAVQHIVYPQQTQLLVIEGSLKAGGQFMDSTN